MNRLLRILLILSLPVLLVPWQGAASAQESADKNTAKIRELQQERVNVLQKMVELALVGYRSGTLDFKTVHAAQHELLDAQLDMVETHEERILLVTSQLKLAEEALGMAEARFKAALSSSLEVHQAKSAVLRVKIQLLKLQQVDATKNPE